MSVNTGSPTGGDTYGDGTPIVGSAERHQHKRRGSLRREARVSLPIKGSRVGKSQVLYEEVCVMQRADAYLELIRERGKNRACGGQSLAKEEGKDPVTGEPDALKDARPVRRRGVGKGLPRYYQEAQGST